MFLYRQRLRMGAVIACCLLTTAANSQEFFAGKTVTLVVGYQVGSGYDTVARFVARHLPRFIPGTPTVIVRNMPGAGTLTAANYVANSGPKDGTTIALIARGMLIEPLLGGQSVRFDPLSLNWIGSTSHETSVAAVRSDTGIKSLDDAKKREVLVAGAGPGTDGNVFPTALNQLFGTKFKIVNGYRSGAELLLAVERKEADGRGAWSWASFRVEAMGLLQRGELTLLVQYGSTKAPEIPDVPLVFDLVKTEEQKQMLDLLLAGLMMAWPVFAPAEVPQENVATLRKAFMAMLKDPETLADAKKIGVDIAPVPGEVISESLKKIYATPPALVEKVRQLTGKK